MIVVEVVDTKLKCLAFLRCLPFSHTRFSSFVYGIGPLSISHCLPACLCACKLPYTRCVSKSRFSLPSKSSLPLSLSQSDFLSVCLSLPPVLGGFIQLGSLVPALGNYCASFYVPFSVFFWLLFCGLHFWRVCVGTSRIRIPRTNKWGRAFYFFLFFCDMPPLRDLITRCAILVVFACVLTVKLIFLVCVCVRALFVYHSLVSYTTLDRSSVVCIASLPF